MKGGLSSPPNHSLQPTSSIFGKPWLHRIISSHLRMAPSGIWGLKQKSLKRITPNPPVKLVLPQRIFIASVSYYPFSIPYLSVSTSANLGDLPERMIDSHPYRVCTFGHHPFLACDCSICPVTTRMGQEVSTAIVIDGFVSKIFHSALFVKQRLYLALNQGLFMLIYSLV